MDDPCDLWLKLGMDAALDLSTAKIPHAGRLDRSGAAFTFTEGAEADWQLLRIDAPAVLGRRVMLTVDAEVPEGRRFYVNGSGGDDLALVARSGERQTIEAVFDSHDPFITFGLAAADPVYSGDGARLTIHSVQLAFLSTAIGDQTDKLVLLDAGAAGGLQPKWRPYRRSLEVIFSDALPSEAAKLAGVDYVSSHLVRAALSDRCHPATFYQTAMPGCSSLLRPDPSVLSRYTVAPCFEVQATHAVECRRFDALSALPQPDFVKADIQGGELALLRGMGDRLRDVVAVEAEAHLVAIYQGQPLLGDLIGYLAEFGFRLRDFRPCWNFDGDLIEGDAFFTRAPLTAIEQRKLKIFETVCGLTMHGGGAAALAHIA